MPLKRCTNAEGKHGWSWGNGGCQVAGSDLESKKQAIRIGLKLEGVKKFSEIMKKSKGTFLDYEGLALAKEIFHEVYPRGYTDQLLENIGKFFSKSSIDDFDESEGNFTKLRDEKNKIKDADNGDLIKVQSDDMSTTVDENEEATAKKIRKAENEMFDPNHPNPTAAPNSARSDDGQNDSDRPLNYSDEGPGKKDEETIPGGNYSNLGLKPIDGPRDGSPADTDESFHLKKTDSFGAPDGLIYGSSTKSNLDDDTENKTKILVPKYRYSVSPESQPDVKVPDYPVPSREEMNGENDENYNENRPKGNIYSDDEEEATTASEEYLQDMDYISIAFPLSTERRNKVPSEDFAQTNPDGSHSFPIIDQKSVDSAARLIHHSSDPTKTRRKIVEIAHRKGLAVPPTWSHYDQACSLM